MGNQAFIRATKFASLVAQLLIQGQPGMLLNFEHCIDEQNLLAFHSQRSMG